MTTLRTLTAGVAAGAAVLLLVASVAAGADADSDSAAPGDPLTQAVARGQTLFSLETFGGNGNTCETCHSGGGKLPGMLPDGRQLPSLINAAAIFPRFSRGAGAVVTLEGQVRQCIRGGLGGSPPPAGSPDLVALTAYLGSIALGQAVDIGGAPK